MAWINPLDKLPQIRVDWANHIAQGGLGACVIVLAAVGPFQLSWHQGALIAFGAMSTISVTKKVADYLLEHEPWYVCVGKALVTLLWPVSLVLVS